MKTSTLRHKQSWLRPALEISSSASSQHLRRVTKRGEEEKELLQNHQRDGEEGLSESVTMNPYRPPRVVE